MVVMEKALRTRGTKIPKAITEQIWKTLDEVSDETGELELDGGYLLKYEGWGASCFDSRFKYDESMKNYAATQSPKIHKEWNTEMRRRGYEPLTLGHDMHSGLYGVTYALYKRQKEAGK